MKTAISTHRRVRYKHGCKEDLSTFVIIDYCVENHHQDFISVKYIDKYSCVYRNRTDIHIIIEKK